VFEISQVQFPDLGSYEELAVEIEEIQTEFQEM